MCLKFHRHMPLTQNVTKTFVTHVSDMVIALYIILSVGFSLINQISPKTVNTSKQDFLKTFKKLLAWCIYKLHN